MGFAILLRQCTKGIDNALRGKATAQRKMIELSTQASCIHPIALMNDFLIGSNVRGSTIVSEAMGKGIGIDESHGTKKRPAQRLASLEACVNQALPCPLESFLPWLGLLLRPSPCLVPLGREMIMRLVLEAPALLLTATEEKRKT